jgi:hypothetical protein
LSLKDFAKLLIQDVTNEEANREYRRRAAEEEEMRRRWEEAENERQRRWQEAENERQRQEEENRLILEAERRFEAEEKAKRQAEQQQKWLQGKEAEAALAFMNCKTKLDEEIREIDRNFIAPIMRKMILDPNVENRIVELYRKQRHNVNNFSDVENIVKKTFVESRRKELREQLKNNPYAFYAGYLAL